MTTAEINLNSVVSWSSKAVATEVNDEVVLMNLDQDRCYGLGNTGSDLWRRLSQPIEVAELLTQLESSYEAAPGEIHSDVLRTLQQFASEGLIQVSGSTD